MHSSTRKKIVVFFNSILYKIMFQKSRTKKTVSNHWKKIDSSFHLLDMFLENFTKNTNIKCLALPFEVSINNVLFTGVFDFIIKEGNMMQIGFFDFSTHDSLKCYQSNFVYSIYKESFMREFGGKSEILIYNVPIGEFFSFTIPKHIHKKNLTRIVRFAKIFAEK